MRELKSCIIKENIFREHLTKSTNSRIKYSVLPFSLTLLIYTSTQKSKKKIYEKYRPECILLTLSKSL